MKEDCQLCSIIRNPENAAGGVIHESENFIVIHHQPPIDVKGWVILVPRRHCESQSLLSDGELEELMHLEKRVTRLLEENFKAERVYRVCFSEVVRHIHFHLIPRTDEVPGDRRGPKIFAREDAKLISDSDIDDFAKKLSDLLKK